MIGSFSALRALTMSVFLSGAVCLLHTATAAEHGGTDRHTTVSGTVVDPDGKPVGNVEVVVAGTTHVRTRPDGTFSVYTTLPAHGVAVLTLAGAGAATEIAFGPETSRDMHLIVPFVGGE